MSNLGRRNLSVPYKIEQVRKLEEIEKRKAEQRQDRSKFKDETGQFTTGGKISTTGENGKTRDKLGEMAGCSGKTYGYAKYVMDKSPELWEELKDGKKTIPRHYHICML